MNKPSDDGQQQELQDFEAPAPEEEEVESWWAAYRARIIVGVIVALPFVLYTVAYLSSMAVKEVVPCTTFEVLLMNAPQAMIEEKMKRKPDAIQAHGGRKMLIYETKDMPIVVWDKYVDKEIKRMRFAMSEDDQLINISYDH